MISVDEQWDGLTDEGVCFPALKVGWAEAGYDCRRESCIGWEVGEASKTSFTYEILRSVSEK